jgi:hypothetical protein
MAMTGGVPVRRTGFGLAGFAAGIFALIAVAIPQWVAPRPQVVLRPATVEMHQSFRERYMEHVRELERKRHEKREPAGWREGVPALAVLLALAAITLGVISVLRGEALVYSGVAATLGFGAIAFQLTFFYAIAACLILLLYAGMEQPSGAVELAAVAIGAILVLSILAMFGLGFASALFLAGAAIAILSLDRFFGGF